MFDSIQVLMEDRRMAKLQKHKQKLQERRQSFFILIGVMGLVLIAALTFSAIEPSKEAPERVQAIPTASAATPATAPDDDVLSAKQEQYCFRVNAALPEPQLTQAIDKCLDETSGWTLEQFEENMPADPLG